MELSDLRILSNKSGEDLSGLTISELRNTYDFPQELNNVYSKIFPSGEVYARLLTNIRRKEVHIIGSFHHPELYHIKRKVMECNLDLQDQGRIIEQYIHSLEPDFRGIEKICDGARRAEAKELSIYLTYYPDARQDKKDEPRVPISAKLTMDNLLSSAEPLLKRVGTVDLHAAQIQGFTNRPVNEVLCRYLHFAHLKHEFGSLDEVIFIFPDSASSDRFEEDIKLFNLKYAIIDKSRPGHGVSEIKNYEGHSPEGKTAIILDDMIDGGGTTLGAGERAYELGAKEVIAYTTHYIGSTKVIREKKTGPVKDIVFTEDKFKESRIKVFASDTIPRTEEYREEHKDWFTQFTIAPYLSDLIHCNIAGESHGDKIGEYKKLVLNGSNEELKQTIDKHFIY